MKTFQPSEIQNPRHKVSLLLKHRTVSALLVPEFADGGDTIPRALSNHFLASGKRIVFCCVVGLSQNLLSFRILIHGEKNACEAFCYRFW